MSHQTIFTNRIITFILLLLCLTSVSTTKDDSDKQGSPLVVEVLPVRNDKSDKNNQNIAIDLNTQQIIPKKRVYEDLNKPSELTDNMIKDDIDLGLRHRKPLADKNTKTEDSHSFDVKNDIDLGLKPIRYVESNSENSNSNQDMQLDNHHLEEPTPHIHPHVVDVEMNGSVSGLTPNDQSPGQTGNSLSDIDISNDIDLGLKHKRNHDTPHVSREEAIRKIVRQRRLAHRELVARHLEITNTATKSQKQGTIILDEIPSIKKRQWAPVKHTIHNDHTREINQEPRKIDIQTDIQENEQEDANGLFFQENNSTDICDQYDVDGCSVPLGAPFYFKGTFTKSCNRHDICYHCGVEFGIDRKTCDKAFKNNMANSCLAKYGDGKTTTDQIRKVINDVKKLDDSFMHHLERVLGPALVPSGDGKRDVEKLNSLAKSIEGKVVLRWFNQLANELASDIPTKSTRYRSIGSLSFNKDDLLVVTNEANNVDTNLKMQENPITVTLCDEAVLNIRQNKATRNIDIGCNELELLTCKYFDNVYYLAVRAFGALAYHEKPEFYCNQAFVQKCLPKH